MRTIKQLEFNEKRIDKGEYVKITTKNEQEYLGYLNFYEQSKYFGIGYWGYEFVIELTSSKTSIQDIVELTHIYEYEVNNHTHTLSFGLKENIYNVRFVGEEIENIKSIQVL